MTEPQAVPPVGRADRAARRGPDAGPGADRAARRGGRPDAPSSPGTTRSCWPSQDILALPFPVEYGGLGRRPADGLPGDRGALGGVRHDRPDPGRPGAGLPADRHARARPSSAQRWLPDLAAGRTLIAFALTESGAGSDAGSIAMRAARDGDDYVLDGAKRFITHGSVADLVVVFAVSDPECQAPPPPVLLRRRDGPAGLLGRPARAQDGHPRLAHGRAPLRRRARPGRRTGSARRARASRSRCARSSAPDRGSPPRRVGIAQGALEFAAHYAAERSQFGKPIGEQQMIQAMLADMDAATEAARQLLYARLRRDRRGRRRRRPLGGRV